MSNKGSWHESICFIPISYVRTRNGIKLLKFISSSICRTEQVCV